LQILILPGLAMQPCQTLDAKRQPDSGRFLLEATRAGAIPPKPSALVQYLTVKEANGKPDSPILELDSVSLEHWGRVGGTR